MYMVNVILIANKHGKWETYSAKQLDTWPDNVICGKSKYPLYNVIFDISKYKPQECDRMIY